jgi:hypothetical protein
MSCAYCREAASHEIRGTRLCVEHYIEALEHSAHLTSNFGCDYHPLDYNQKLKPNLELAVQNARIERFVPGEMKESA